MTGTAKTQADKIAALEQEVAALKAKSEPASRLLSAEEQARWQDEMHALRERRMAYAIHPHVVRDLAVVSDADARAIAATARAPTGPTAMAPSSPPVTSSGRSANVPGNGTGWAQAAPLGPPPGLRWVDQQLDAADAKDRDELIEREARRRLAAGRGPRP